MVDKTVEQESQFVQHEACPSCGSSDNLSRYSDGHGYCFGCKHYEKGNSSSMTYTPSTLPKDILGGGEVVLWQSRNLSVDTCRKFGVKLLQEEGLRVFPYYAADGSGLVAQKVRSSDKSKMFSTGDMKAAGLFGQNLWRGGGPRVVITEGEIDAMSVAQAFNLSWPVVSIKRGAASAKKDILEAMEWLSGYEKIVLCFDMDEAGQAATAECVDLFEPGKVYVAQMEYKDASEYVQANKLKELSNAIWEAKPYRPEGIITVADVFDEATKDLEVSRPWFLDTMTQWTFGRRLGEIYGFGAGTGVGKTDFFAQQITFDILNLNERVGIFFLEQHPSETVQRLAGKMFEKPFHVPDGSWTQEERIAAISELRDLDKVCMYRHFGKVDWSIIKSRIQSVVHQYGVKHIYLDHLTALADPSNERESLELIMEEMAGLAQRLKIVIHYISHLATPDKGSHEEGAHVQLRHFKGSRSIGFWTHYAFGLERNKNDEDEERRSITTLRCIKDRFTGRADGKTLLLRYDQATTQVKETLYERPATSYGFQDQGRGEYAL